ncbi:MAG: hypothetical protein ACHQ2Y_09485, partial [Candidatus Lutacidiplasmatales archaeon]
MVLFSFVVIAGSLTLVGGLGHPSVGRSPLPSGVRAAGNTTTISACTESALATALAVGGAVAFGLACYDLKMNASIGIGHNLSVNLTAGIYPVTLDGQYRTQFFIVTGGQLSVTGITFEHGFVQGTAGLNGLGGSAGSTGANGAAGADGTSYGQAGAPGSAGAAGKAGHAGAQGQTGVAGRGGAIWIQSGNVTLTADKFTSNSAWGGGGGMGG